MGKFLDLKWQGGAVFGLDPNDIVKSLVEDQEAFKDISRRLLAAVQTQYKSAFTNTSATAERKGEGPIKRQSSRGSYHGVTGSMTAPGYSSGQTLANFSANSNKVWAGAWRGQMEWYSFLHDKGTGYAYWSVDGRHTRGARINEPGRKRSHKGSHSMTGREANRGREAQSGTTTFRPAPFMFISSATEQAVWARVQEAIQRNCDTKPIFGQGGN